MGLKIAGAVLLAAGILLLIVSLCLMLFAESGLGFVLIVVSILANVVGIVLLTTRTGKKRKK